MRSEGYGKNNKDDTLYPVLDAPDRDDLILWLRACPLLHVEGEFAMVHAGLLPQWSVEQADSLAQEASRALRANSFRDYLATMRGGQPAAWRDDLTGWDRMRVIANAMTRMRFCTSAGAMEFHAKGGPEDAPPDHMPWFAVPQRRSRTHTIVCGHWSALGLHMDDGVMAIDTGCLWGGQLTAVRLEDRRVFQVSSRKN
jgi:bis(5'-nucleosyl)-tetraphosphatase (symmetrical)